MPKLEPINDWELITEPPIAWRKFKLAGRGGWLLDLSGAPFHPDEDAWCFASCPGNGQDGPSPHDCRLTNTEELGSAIFCGYYSWKDPKKLDPPAVMGVSKGAEMIAKVEVHGLFREHEWGYRAQRMRIVAVSTSDEDVWKRYNCRLMSPSEVQQWKLENKSEPGSSLPSGFRQALLNPPKWMPLSQLQPQQSALEYAFRQFQQDAKNASQHQSPMQRRAVEAKYDSLRRLYDQEMKDNALADLATITLAKTEQAFKDGKISQKEFELKYGPALTPADQAIEAVLEELGAQSKKEVKKGMLDKIFGIRLAGDNK